MRIQIMIIILSAILSSCNNSARIASEDLLKIEKTLSENLEQQEAHNLLLEAIIRDQIAEKEYHFIDSIEIIMDTILNEFSQIENYVESTFSLNPKENISSNQIEIFTDFYSKKVDNIISPYSDLIRRNRMRYGLKIEEVEKRINDFNNNFAHTFISETFFQEYDNSYNFSVLLIKGEISKQKNKVLSDLNSLIIRPCFIFEKPYPLALNAYKTYEFGETTTLKVAVVNYVSRIQENTELFINGEKAKECVDGIFYYDVPTNVKGSQEISFKIVKKNPLNGEVIETTSSFSYEVK